MISLHQFYFDAIAGNIKRLSENLHAERWRYGQIMFNHLLTVKPELAERVRAQSYDPFYCDSPADPRFDAFVEFIETNWRTNDRSS